MLNSAPAKLCTKILYTVMATFFEEIRFPCDNQNDGGRGRCCAKNLLIVQNQRERQQGLSKPCTMIFLDFSKAFDRVDRTCTFQALHWHGTPEIPVRAIKKIYEDRKVIIRLGLVETKPMKYYHGIIQDDALSPLLFVKLVDAMSLRPNESNKHTANPNDLLFVDDFVFFCGKRSRRSSSAPGDRRHGPGNWVGFQH